MNNAGRGQRALWLDVDLRVDRELFEINVLGPVSLTQEVLPHMIQRKQGHVVVVSSVAGKLGEYLLCSFCCHVFNIIKHYHFDSSAMYLHIFRPSVTRCIFPTPAKMSRM